MVTGQVRPIWSLARYRMTPDNSLNLRSVQKDAKFWVFRPDSNFRFFQVCRDFQQTNVVCGKSPILSGLFQTRPPRYTAVSSFISLHP